MMTIFKSEHLSWAGPSGSQESFELFDEHFSEKLVLFNGFIKKKKKKYWGLLDNTGAVVFV